MRWHGRDPQIGDLERVGDSKSDNGALMPNTCLGENRETNINIYISATTGPDANGKKAAIVPLEMYDFEFVFSQLQDKKKLTFLMYNMN